MFKQKGRQMGLHRRRVQNNNIKDNNLKLQIFKESVKTIGKEYCEESSIGGLKFLVSNSTPPIERIIWVITLIGALWCSVFLVQITFETYYTTPIVTTQLPEGFTINKIFFPVVGFCTNNRISKRAVTELARNLLQEERNKMYTEKKMLELLFGLGELYNVMQPSSGKSSAMELHQALGDYDINEVLKNLTPRCEDLLMRCAWNRQLKNCTDLFEFRVTMNGYCCIFNYLREPNIFDNNHIPRYDMVKQGNRSSFGTDQGLKVLIKFDESDDFFYHNPMQGAQVILSTIFDYPDAQSGKFAMAIISSSVQMTVKVTASLTKGSRDMQKIPVRLRGCLFEYESSYIPFYMYGDCLLKCRMMFLLAHCNCTPFNMPRMENTKTCDLRDVGCLRRYYAQSISLRPEVDPVPKELELELVGGGIRCPMCYPTCYDLSYNYEFMNSEINPDKLNLIPDKYRVEWVRGVNYTGTSIVHVKYGRPLADHYVQDVIMKWFDLISTIGSTCGFVIGFSFVSVAEFIYYFVIKLTRDVCARRHQIHEQPAEQNRTTKIGDTELTFTQKRRSKLNHAVNTGAVKPTPTTNHGHIRRPIGDTPLYWNELGKTMGIGNNTSLAIQ